MLADAAGDHMDSEEAPKIIKQVIPADDRVESNQENFAVLDSKAREPFPFEPNRLQALLTLQWLSQHYEAIAGVSLPRCLIYAHYSDFCFKNQFPPVNSASFGKVIRQVFPELQTRRLGTRGQSKYHYYGIRVKESSPYFGVFLESQRVSPAIYRSSSRTPHLPSHAQWEHHSMITEQSDNPNSAMTSISTLLPEFPTAAQTQPWGNLSFEQVDSVISEYRNHCQVLIEHIVRGKLEEVPNAVHRFWKDLPESTQAILRSDCKKLSDLIAVCDNILYQIIVNVLIQGTVHQLPPSLLQTVRHFSCTFQKVVEESSPAFFESLHLRRMEVAKRFCHLLKRKTSLSHLAQATRTVLNTKVTVTQMCHDWRKRTEQNTVCSQLMWTIPGSSPNVKTTVKKCFSELARLLEKHASVEDHIRWLHSVRSKCLKMVGDEETAKETAERNFLLQWSYVCNLLIRDQTLRSATSFGSFHLLHLLYEEYLLYMVDVQQNQKKERALWKKLFDTDTDVPSYFLTSSNTSDFETPKGLPDAPDRLYHLAPTSLLPPAQPCRVSHEYATGPRETQYLYQPFATTSSGGLYIKPCASTAKCPTPSSPVIEKRVSITSGPSPTALAPATPPGTHTGYSATTSSMFLSQTQTTPKMPHKRDTEFLSSSLQCRSPSIAAVPHGPVTLLGYQQQVVTQPQHPTAVHDVITKYQTRNEPPPLQPIKQTHLQDVSGKKNLLTGPQHKLLATKIIKAVPIPGGTPKATAESKQKPLSFQFSITTNQKLNLAKGQMLTTTTGERYLINEVTSSTYEGDGAAQDKSVDGGQQGK
ncbi:transcription factor RFX4-like [Asterias rubens]|uniref:transcription factor RFX4-like n=1 Tax=Asterias rubens TaxID=7604 RepID=UPI001455A2CD|nr:transcription factor RFX4-like [Asterias rubens]